MKKINYILFDAANTLIHKPLLWERFQNELKNFNHDIPLELLKKNHKLLSECLRFPDRTSRDFYQQFNSELLYSLGIIPEEELLDKIFQACTYLPWSKFEDTEILPSLQQSLGIVSNFNNSLKKTVEDMLGPVFKNIVVSENFGVAKPESKFYELALKEIDIDPSNILYIGDSIKLDIEPALKLGINAVLIDRDNTYPYFTNRISSLKQLPQFL
jgi:putative hydrolase of the HAD superfamily